MVKMKSLPDNWHGFDVGMADVEKVVKVSYRQLPAREIPCRCESEYLCVQHVRQQVSSFAATSHVQSNQPMEDGSHRPSVLAGRNFPTNRRVTRRAIDESKAQDFLLKWASERGIKLGDCIPKAGLLRLLQVIWTYRDLESTGILDMGQPTDLVVHRTRIKPGTPVYKAKRRKYAPDKEFWFRKFITEGLETGMYERTILANGHLSPWGADAVIVPKPSRDEPRLTFNYHWVFEETPGNNMEMSSSTHRFLSAPSHQVFSGFDLKNAYWTIEIHPDDRHYLAFDVPGVGQVQPTRMAQGARSSSFTMNEVGNIAFGEIPPPSPEPSLISGARDSLADMSWYIDDIFAAHDSWETHMRFIEHHLFPRLLWARFRLSFTKMEIGVSQISALGELHEVGGKISIKPERVKTILEWPIPADASGVRSFLGVVATTRRWVKNYSEMARPLSRLTGTKEDWKWGQAEQVAFDLLRNKCARAGCLFGWIPHLPVKMYFDASGFAIGCYICQEVDGVSRPLFYDSQTLTPAERKYDTYKRELKAMVTFGKKHAFMLQGSQTSTMFTDHKPLLGFLNSKTHEDIYARWAQFLRSLNVKIQWIQGERNIVADGLSRTIFNKDCSPNDITQELSRLIQSHEENDAGWFWKSGKGGYEQWLRDMTQEEREVAIDEEAGVQTSAGWTCLGFPGAPWVGLTHSKSIQSMINCTQTIPEPDEQDIATRES